MDDKYIDIKILKSKIFSYENKKELGIFDKINKQIEHGKHIDNIVELDNLIKKLPKIESKEKDVFTPYDTGKIRGKNI